MFRDHKARARFIMVSLIVCLLLSLGACGSGGSSQSAPSTPSSSADRMESGTNNYAPAPAASAPTYNDGGAYDMAEQDAVSSAEAPVDMAGGAEAVADAGAGYNGEAGSVTDGRKLTFSASMSINTKNYDADYIKINSLITQAGGYVATEETSDYQQLYGRNDGRYTYLSARIPANGYDSFLDSLSGVGEVASKNKSSQDLTTEYFDTEARIEMLELRKERLMAYLVEARKAEDIVAFERELSDVLYELDQYQGNKRHLDQLVEYATVDISLSELITPETIGKDGEPLGDRASEAFALSSGNVSAFLENAAIFFAAAAPVIILLVVIAAIVWVIVWLIRKLLKKIRKNREPKKPRGRQVYAQMPVYGPYPGQGQAPSYGQDGQDPNQGQTPVQEPDSNKDPNQ